MPCLAGLIVLLFGFWATWKDLLRGKGSDRLVVLGRACFAAPMALFGAEHFASSQGIMQAVPAWMPVRLFWVYFVGVAEIAAALSIVSGKLVRLSATLLALMFCLFVAMVHAPLVAGDPKSALLWTVLIRDAAFAAGALALSRTVGNSRVPAWIPRVVLAIALTEFGVRQLLHPELGTGVPLTVLTPAWVPLPKLWGYLTGIVLLAGGVAMLANWRARLAAVWAGGVMALVTLFMNLPMFFLEKSQFTLGMNVVADTLLFGAAAWLIAESLPVH